jgi:hypothetical protein
MEDMRAGRRLFNKTMFVIALKNLKSLEKFYFILEIIGLETRKNIVLIIFFYKEGRSFKIKNNLRKL